MTNCCDVSREAPLEISIVSNNNDSHARVLPGEDIPRMEPWLAVSLLSFIPGIGLFILPVSAMIPLYVAMAVLLTTGVGMFLRSEWRKKKA
jgi:hypothetical protein